jgi:hypothetical protein
MFKIGDKEYDAEKLSDKGKVFLNQIVSAQNKKNSLIMEVDQCNVLIEHYMALLKTEVNHEE